MSDATEDAVPDADGYEQKLSAMPDAVTHQPPAISDDVPEADAIEQALPAPLDDEDAAPR